MLLIFVFLPRIDSDYSLVNTEFVLMFVGVVLMVVGFGDVEGDLSVVSTDLTFVEIHQVGKNGVCSQSLVHSESM